MRHSDGADSHRRDCGGPRSGVSFSIRVARDWDGVSVATRPAADPVPPAGEIPAVFAGTEAGHCTASSHAGGGLPDSDGASLRRRPANGVTGGGYYIGSEFGDDSAVAAIW